jgi:predicted nucleotidyltransferase
MEALDPFYDPEEESKAIAQSARNSDMRKALRERASVSEQPSEGGSKEFIQLSAQSTDSFENGTGNPWMPPFGYPPYDNLFLRLHQELLDFTRWVSLSKQELKLRESFLHRLNGVCKELWPRCKVVPFGSYLTGLSLPSSDIDISVIHVPTEHDELGDVGCLRRLANRLLEEQQVSFVELRETAKIPILRIKDTEPPFCEIDINLNSDAPQATSKFVLRNAVDKYPQFRPLILFIKCFLLQRNLADTFTGGVGSYLLSCLVLGFLQQHAISFQTRGADLTSLGHLLFDFFSFYGKDFRFEREGLSVRRGGSRFPKSSRQFEMPSVAYTNRRSLPWNEALCVESPLEPELDIGNKVFQWKAIRSAFMQARQTIIGDVQNYNPANSKKSLIAPAFLDPNHEMFQNRAYIHSITSSPVCPLKSMSDLKFKPRSASIPPSPYSDDEIDLEGPHGSSKYRRHSDDPYRRVPREEERQGRHSFEQSKRIVFDSDSSGNGSRGHKRSRR